MDYNNLVKLNLEIKLIRSASRHQVPFKFLECIVDIFKDVADDSEIIKKVTLSEAKARYIASVRSRVS